MIKWFWKNYFWLLGCAAGLGATPAIWQYTRASRGYNALGGEIFVPVLVPLVWFLWNCIKTMWRDMKKEYEDV